jgi:hypothetical protein
MPRHIPDWPSFDPGKHAYIIATGGGDGWEALPPLNEAVQQDIRSVAEDCYTDEEAAQLLNIDWQDWINSLHVVDQNEIEVATFNTAIWHWQTPEEWLAWCTKAAGFLSPLDVG